MIRSFTNVNKVLLIMTICMVFIGITAYAAPEDDPKGSGTVESPYQIATKQHLNKLSIELDAHYILISDIDLNNELWTPIGDSSNPFTGTLDGNNHTISNLKIELPGSNHVGLFGYIDGAIVRNVIIHGVDVTGRDETGALFGTAKNNFIVDHVGIENGRVVGHTYVGGIIGSGSGIRAKVLRSWSTIDVDATSYAGGLAGHGYLDVDGSYAVSDVKVEHSIAGGLIGDVPHHMIRKIDNSFALGSVIQIEPGIQGFTGGLVGRAQYHKISNSYAANKLVVTAVEKIGGIYGGTSMDSDAFIVESTYYDSLSSGFIPQSVNDISQLTTGMKAQSTFVGWDFEDTWYIEEGESYPYLRQLPIPNEVRVGLPQGDVAGGLGTEVDPYLIGTREHLNNMRYNMTANYLLVADINLNDELWTPIGSSRQPFTGTLDGGGHTISNLKIDLPQSNDVGLFGYVDGASIRNLVINGVSVSGGNQTGVLFGSAINHFMVDHIGVENGHVTGLTYVGGLIGSGSGSNSSIIGSWSTVDVNAVSYAGGLAGHGYLDVYGSYAVSDVRVESNVVGGLIGDIPSHTIRMIENSFALGSVTQLDGDIDGFAGGLVGRAQYHRIRNSYAANLLDYAASAKVGGLYGGSDLEELGYATESSYYDGVASGFVPRSATDISRLTNAMKAQSTFAEWNFVDIWDIEEGQSYPYLQGIPSPDEVISGLPQWDVAGGVGTAINPYLIETSKQLNNIRYDIEGHYLLVADIYLNNEPWIPIGNDGRPFKGILDGNDYKITDLNIQQVGTDNVGFFAFMDQSEVKNIIFDGVHIQGSDNVGALAGTAINNFIIKDVRIGDGHIRGEVNIGGMIGSGHGNLALIDRSWSTLDVNAFSLAGGLVGYGFLDISNSYVVGDIRVTQNVVGGLIGAIPNGNLRSITNSFALGTVQQHGINIDGYVGGLIGNSESVQLIHSYAANTIIHESSSYLGGLSGTVVSVNSSYYDSQVVGEIYEAYDKSTAEMNILDTFAGWDFTNTWELTPERSYPRLYRVAIPTQLSKKSRTSHSITLQWNPIADATGYELELDRGKTVVVGNTTEFTHTSLEPGTLHYYRVRALNGSKKSYYSPRVEIYSLLTTPQNVRSVRNGQSLTFGWNAVEGATQYNIELNGQRIELGNVTTYTISNAKENMQYTIRIKAINAVTESSWTISKSHIQWSDTGIGLCICQVINDERASTDIVIIANNMNEIYTLHVEMEYVTTRFEIPNEVVNLLGEDQLYHIVDIDSSSGKLKVLLSDVEEHNVYTGATELIRLSFASLSDTLEPSKVMIMKLYLVNSKGEYLTVSVPDEFNLWTLQGE